MVDYNIEKLDISEFTEREMKKVKKYFDGTILKEKKKLEEKNKNIKEE